MFFSAEPSAEKTTQSTVAQDQLAAYRVLAFPLASEALKTFFDRSPHRKLAAPLFDRLKTQLLSAVSHMHMAGVLHRDLKPSNMLVATDETGIIKFLVADLGRSRDVSLAQRGVESKDRAVVPIQQGAVGR